MSVLGFGDRAAVAENQDVGLHTLGRVVHRLTATGRLFERHGRGRTDHPLRRQTHVRDQDVGSRLRHRGRLIVIEAVRRGEQPQLASHPDHVDFQPVAHPGLFEAHAEVAVEQADRGKVLHAREPRRLHLFQEQRHQSKRIGPADTGQHGRLGRDRQDFTRHVHHDGVRIAVGHHPSQRTSPPHAEAARVVDHNQVDPPRLLQLGGQPRPRPASNNRLTSGHLGSQSGEDVFALEQAHGVAFDCLSFLLDDGKGWGQVVQSSVFADTRLPILKVVDPRKLNFEPPDPNSLCPISCWSNHQ